MTKEQMYKNRVKKGIAWLNRKKPGWYKKIKITELQMYDTKTCICGQLFGSYSFVYAQGLAPGQTIDFGFNLAGTARNFDLLEKIWIQEIRKLRKKK